MTALLDRGPLSSRATVTVAPKPFDAAAADLQQDLAALGSLVEAVRTDLVSVGADGTILCRPPADPVYAPLDPLVIERAEQFAMDCLSVVQARSSPCWVTAGRQAVMLLWGGSRDGAGQVVAFSFAEPLAACRLRVGRRVPDLVRLIARQCGHSADAQEVRHQFAAALTALDHSSFGVIAVREDHSPLFMNRTARAMLADETVLHLRRGAIRPIDHQDAVRFHVALDSVIEPSPASSGEPHEALVMLLSEQRSAEATVAVVAPCSPTSPLAGVSGAAAFIYLFRPAAQDVQGFETLCDLLGFSGAETRLVGQLLRGQTLAEAADAMRIKVETARSYLKQAFSKTGTHRQTDLVVLMQRYARSLRGNFTFRRA